MRRATQPTTAASLTASKRITIAFCAAVAMVLGAMSVGAGPHAYWGGNLPAGLASSATNTTGGAATPQTSTHANTTTIPVGSGELPVNTPTISADPDFHRQHMLTPILVAPLKTDPKHQPPLVVPNIISQTSLTLGPLSVSANLSNNSVQLNSSLALSAPVQGSTSLPDLLSGATDTSSNTSNAPTTNTSAPTDPTSTTTDPSSTPPQAGTNPTTSNTPPASGSSSSPAPTDPSAGNGGSGSQATQTQA